MNLQTKHKRIKWLSILWVACSSSLIAQQISMEIRIGQGTEAVGLPLQRPEVLQGRIESVLSPLKIQVTHSNEGALAQAIGTNPHYLEVTGPSGHLLEGERFELDEEACRSLPDGTLALESSPLNTLSAADSQLLGAEYVITPHWTLERVLGEMIRHRLSLPKPSGTPTVWLPLGNGNNLKLIPRLSLPPQSRLAWILDRSTVWPAQKTILPPGTAFLMKNPSAVGYGFSLGGDQRKTSCRAPLTSGPNLVSYPFASDLRLGLDWGKESDGLAASASPTSCDRIYLYDRENFYIYGLEKSGRWMRILGWGSESVRWDVSGSALSTIPAGQGFVLFKLKSDPLHIFRPPQP